MSAYQQNYDRIAQDHIRHWRETGENPFQGESVLRHNEATTLDMIRRNLPHPTCRILDAGCGMGDLMLNLQDQFIEGVDISKDYLEIARERGLEVMRARVEKLPHPHEWFDMVIATDILEHVLDLNKAVKELLRVLKTGGVLIVRTPNEEALAFDTDPYEYVHLRRFDVPTMHLLFRKIFRCEMLEIAVTGEVVNVAVRK